MKFRSIAFGLMMATVLCFASAGAIAQIDPEDSGAGTKLGMQEQSNSGQVGDVTLFQRGQNTLVVINIKSEPRGHREPAHIHRGHSCDDLNPKPAFGLADVVNGWSRTLVQYPMDKLLSGNYVVNAHISATNLPHYVSCGQLYR